MFKGILKRAVATAVVAASVFLAVIFLGVAVFYALQLMTTPLGAAAITFGLFALTALIVALVFLKRAEGDDEDEEEEHMTGVVPAVTVVVVGSGLFGWGRFTGVCGEVDDC